MAYELGFSSEEICEGKIDSSQRNHTVAFQYPENGHCYIAFSFDSFCRFICSWIVVVRNCYLLVSSLLQNTFYPFVHNTPFLMIFESDKEVDAEVEMNVVAQQHSCKVV